MPMTLLPAAVRRGVAYVLARPSTAAWPGRTRCGCHCDIEQIQQTGIARWRIFKTHLAHHTTEETV
jgi:hypothetical protein